MRKLHECVILLQSRDAPFTPLTSSWLRRAASTLTWQAFALFDEDGSGQITLRVRRVAAIGTVFSAEDSSG